MVSKCSAALAIVSMVVTFITLVLNAIGVNMIGISIQWWELIWFSIFVACVVIVLWQLNSELKKLKSEDAERKRNIERMDEEIREIQLGKRLPSDINPIIRQ